MPTLLLTPRFTADAQALWRAATRLGWQVHRLQGWQVPDDLLACKEPVFYVEAMMAPIIAAKFGRVAVEPPDDWLPNLPQEYRKRSVQLCTLREAKNIKHEMFMKPPNDKSFKASVMLGAQLPAEFDASMPVLVSDVVAWESEFRCFVLRRKVVTVSLYARFGALQREHDFVASEAEMQAAESFAQLVASDPRVALAESAVIDVGLIDNAGWAVIEQNAAWGAGIYGCDPEQVLSVLQHACPRASQLR